jgi:hypothetical protein
MSLFNELTLLNNINIERVKKSNEFSQQTNQENDYDLLDKYNFNLYSRNILKNNFFSKYLLTPIYNKNGSIENKIIFKNEKSKESPLFLDSYNNNDEKNIKKNNLSLTILNYNNNQIKKIPTKKFSHDEYRKKKYVKHYPLFDLNDNKEDLRKSLEKDHYIYTFKYPKNNLQKSLISKPNYFISHNSKLDESKLGKTLYKVLPLEVNNLFIKRFKSKKREFPKIRNNSLMKKLNSVNFGIRKNPIEIIKSKNKPVFFISMNTDNFNNNDLVSLNPCEKKRYEKMMDILIDLKKKLEDNPTKHLKITRNFLIKNGINNPKYFTVEKINNLLLYIKGNYKLDATKSLKNNIINILDENLIL